MRKTIVENQPDNPEVKITLIDSDGNVIKSIPEAITTHRFIVGLACTAPGHHALVMSPMYLGTLHDDVCDKCGEQLYPAVIDVCVSKIPVYKCKIEIPKFKISEFHEITPDEKLISTEFFRWYHKNQQEEFPIV